MSRLEPGSDDPGTSLAVDRREHNALLEPFAVGSPAQTLLAAVSERLA
jgi:hypothetical protein